MQLECTSCSCVTQTLKAASGPPRRAGLLDQPLNILGPLVLLFAVWLGQHFLDFDFCRVWFSGDAKSIGEVDSDKVRRITTGGVLPQLKMESVLVWVSMT
jgi:hypothetical protein